MDGMDECRVERDLADMEKRMIRLEERVRELEAWTIPNVGLPSKIRACDRAPTTADYVHPVTQTIIG